MYSVVREISVKGWLRASVTGRALLCIGGCFGRLAAAHKARRDRLLAERALAGMSDLDLVDIGLGPADTTAILEAAYAARARAVRSWLDSLARSAPRSVASLLHEYRPSPHRQ